jgi:hypothetical protein
MEEDEKKNLLLLVVVVVVVVVKMEPLLAGSDLLYMMMLDGSCRVIWDDDDDDDDCDGCLDSNVGDDDVGEEIVNESHSRMVSSNNNKEINGSRLVLATSKTLLCRLCIITFVLILREREERRCVVDVHGPSSVPTNWKSRRTQRKRLEFKFLMADLFVGG